MMRVVEGFFLYPHSLISCPLAAQEQPRCSNSTLDTHTPPSMLIAYRSSPAHPQPKSNPASGTACRVAWHPDGGCHLLVPGVEGDVQALEVRAYET